MTTDPEPVDRIDRTIALARDLSRLTGPAEVVRHCLRRMQLMAPACRLFHVAAEDGRGTRVRVVELSSLAEAGMAQDEASVVAVESPLLSARLRAENAAILEGLAPEGDAGWEALARPRTLAAVPVFRAGALAYLLILTTSAEQVLAPDLLDELTWQANLHAQATAVARETDELRRAHAKLDRDLGYISRLQQRILPDAIPPLEGVHIDVCSRPSERSGGDFYDFFPLPDGRWAVLLADVCGHGTATAVLMAITHAMTRLARPFIRPHAFLGFLNAQLVKRYTAQTGAFVAACVVVYDPPKRELTFSLAGLPSPRLVRAGGVELLDRARGAGLGLFPTSRYVSSKTTVAPGDLLILFTDGLSDAVDPHGEMYGEERLDAQIVTASRVPNPAAALEAEVLAFTDDHPDQDDRTVLALRFA